ncbi:hypothetical protein GCM10009670_22590 [Citricoccus alkalitolerans]
MGPDAAGNDAAVRGHLEFLKHAGVDLSGIDFVEFDPHGDGTEDDVWFPYETGLFGWRSGNLWHTSGSRPWREESLRDFRARSGLPREQAQAEHLWIEAARSVPDVHMFMTSQPEFLRKPFNDGVFTVDSSDGMAALGLHQRLSGRTILPGPIAMVGVWQIARPELLSTETFLPELDRVQHQTRRHGPPKVFDLLASASGRFSRCLAIRDRLIASYSIRGWAERTEDPAELVADFALQLSGLIDALLRAVNDALGRPIESDTQVKTSKNDLKKLSKGAPAALREALLQEDFKHFNWAVSKLRNTIHAQSLGKGTEGGVGRTGPTVALPVDISDGIRENAEALGSHDRWMKDPPLQGANGSRMRGARIHAPLVVEDLLVLAMGFIRRIVSATPWPADGPDLREGWRFRPKAHHHMLLSKLYGLEHLLDPQPA